MLPRLRELAFRLSYGRARLLMSELRKRWIVFVHPRADIRFGPHVYLGPGFSLEIPQRGTFVAGPRCEFRRGFRAEVAGDGRIVFGADCVCTYSVLMQCSTSIDIGDRVMFGQATIVVDGQHRFRDLDRPMLEQGYDFTPIVIEDDATITTKCSIMERVGRRAFVGANAVVTRPVPPYTVAVGAPARPVDYFGPPGQEPPGLVATR
jgi:acetyltransferase-like isoleucine patch superfamily enzyme